MTREGDLPLGQRPEGEEKEVDLRDLWNFVQRNRLIIVGGLVLGIIAAAARIWWATPIYESAVTIRIEGDEPLGPLAMMPGLETGPLGVETEMGVLRSRTLAEDVVDSLELMLAVSRPRGLPRAQILDDIHFESWASAESFTLTRMSEGVFLLEGERSGEVDTVRVDEPVVVRGGTFRLMPAAGQYERIDLQVIPYRNAVRGVSTRLLVARPDRNASIVQIRFRSADTLLVDDVANLVARRYIQARLESRQTTAFNTVTFLRGQIDSLTLELTHAEDQLQAYREGEQVISLQAEAGAQVGQLARLQADRNSLDAERGALQTLMDGINREAASRPVQRGEASPFRRLVAFPSLLQQAAASQFLENLTRLEDQRSELLRRRTMEDPDVESLTRRIEQLEEQLRMVAVTYLQGRTNEVASLDRTLARFSSELSRIPAKELAVARLERQTQTLREIYMLLQTRLKESEIAQAAEDPSVRVLDPAVVIPVPVAPRKTLTLLVGALLGLVAGAFGGAAKDFLDRTVHTREDVEVATGGLPLLGIIPDIGLSAVNGKSANGTAATKVASGVDRRLVTLHAPRGLPAEAYRALRTSLRFSRMGEPPKTIVVTSALPQDGKSTTAANLAISLAQQGSRTLLVDADLRRGVVAKLFVQRAQPGLSNVLVGDLGSRDAFRQIEVGKGVFLHILTAGAAPPNPAELIASDRMDAFLRKLEEHYDAIIIDTPPLNLVTDAAVLGVRSGGVILVTRASVTDKGAVRHASDVLRSVRANVLGTVLNGMDQRDGRYYGSAYGPYYGSYSGYYGEAETSRTRGEKATV